MAPACLARLRTVDRNMQVTNWKYDQRIVSDPNNCAIVIRELVQQLEQSGWENKDVFGIHMAMEEAIMNAIEHGNQSDPAKRVHIVIELADDRFEARITDQGDGFDLDDVPDPTADENLEKTSGRGVMLIQHFVDQVCYNEVGNSVHLVKQRSSATDD